MSATVEFEPFSAYADIKKWRVASRPPPPSDEIFKLLNQKKKGDLPAVPGAAKYAELVGGEAKFRQLANEGNEYKWFEAFAAAEVLRIGALPNLLYMTARPTEVGYGDVFALDGRPFDVKTVPPSTFKGSGGSGGFSVSGTLEDRLFSKGGYSGMNNKSYQAVLILDVSFEANLEALNASMKAIFSGKDDASRKGHSWRVIQICVDYNNQGYATYNQKPHKDPAE